MKAVKTATREQLDAVARELYREQFAQAPAKVRNASAPAALGEHRSLRFRGHRYTVPPLPWRDGYSLLVAKHTLAVEDAEPGIRAVLEERALRVVRRVLGRVVRRPLSRRILSPFRDITTEEATQLIDWLLYVPDESPVASGPGGTADLMDGLLEFCRAFPGWLNKKGEPLTWAHYQYGLRYLARDVARQSIRMASAFRAAQAVKKEDWQQWYGEMKNAAGWNG